MNPELINPIDEEESIIEGYADPEKIDLKTETAILKEGNVSNVRTIETFSQPVAEHADRVLVGDVDKHADQIFEAEIILPDGKKLLAVYKPDNGANHGTEIEGKPIPLPKNTSPNSRKEAAAWIVAENLGLEKISMPAVVRTLNEGEGSLRPYIYGKPLGLLNEEQADLAMSNQNTIEDIALYDYLLQTMDRRDNNLIWEKPIDGQRQLKVIDHSLTFLNEDITRRFNFKGPRLMLSFDNSKDPPKLKHKPLPPRLLEQLDNFTQNQDAIKNELSSLLNQEEIDGLFERVNKALETKTFL